MLDVHTREGRQRRLPHQVKETAAKDHGGAGLRACVSESFETAPATAGCFLFPPRPPIARDSRCNPQTTRGFRGWAVWRATAIALKIMQVYG